MVDGRFLFAALSLLSAGCVSRPIEITVNQDTTQLRGWVLLLNDNWYLFEENLRERQLFIFGNENCVTLINGSGRPNSDLLVYFERAVWVRGHVAAWDDPSVHRSDNGAETRSYQGSAVGSICNRPELFVFTEIGVG